jgi:hypothetical protein
VSLLTLVACQEAAQGASADKQTLAAVGVAFTALTRSVELAGVRAALIKQEVLASLARLLEHPCVIEHALECLDRLVTDVGSNAYLIEQGVLGPVVSALAQWTRAAARTTAVGGGVADAAAAEAAVQTKLLQLLTLTSRDDGFKPAFERADGPAVLAVAVGGPLPSRAKQAAAEVMVNLHLSTTPASDDRDEGDNDGAGADNADGAGAGGSAGADFAFIFEHAFSASPALTARALDVLAGVLRRTPTLGSLVTSEMLAQVFRLATHGSISMAYKAAHFLHVYTCGPAWSVAVFLTSGGALVVNGLLQGYAGEVRQWMVAVVSRVSGCAFRATQGLRATAKDIPAAVANSGAEVAALIAHHTDTTTAVMEAARLTAAAADKGGGAGDFPAALSVGLHGIAVEAVVLWVAHTYEVMTPAAADLVAAGILPTPTKMAELFAAVRAYFLYIAWRLFCSRGCI